MNTDLSAHYNMLTLEFENMYRTADDLFRKTKQTVEVYATAGIDKLIGKLQLLTGVVDKAIDSAIVEG